MREGWSWSLDFCPVIGKQEARQSRDGMAEHVWDFVHGCLKRHLVWGVLIERVPAKRAERLGSHRASGSLSFGARYRRPPSCTTLFASTNGLPLPMHARPLVVGGRMRFRLRPRPAVSLPHLLHAMLQKLGYPARKRDQVDAIRSGQRVASLDRSKNHISHIALAPIAATTLATFNAPR